MCDSCGVIFAKLHTREVESEFFDQIRMGTDVSDVELPQPEPPTASATPKVVIALLLFVAIAAGAWSLLQRVAPPRSQVLIKKHESIVASSRKAITTNTDLPATQLALDELKKSATSLSDQFAKLTSTRNKEEQARRDYLKQANRALIDALSMPAAELKAQQDEVLGGVEDLLADARFPSIDSEEAESSATKSGTTPDGQMASNDSKPQMGNNNDWRQQLIQSARAEAKSFMQAPSLSPPPRDPISFEAKEATIPEISDDRFAETIAVTQPVVVCCWARSAPDSKRAVDTARTVNGQLNGKALVVSLDIDRSPNTAGAYNVTALPTFLIFKNGRLLSRANGPVKPEVLQQIVERAL